ncbi:hypothetical protein C9374_014137 [Naegleria lovaniensis]|uniref:T4 RNA ligase 1-like N-terminal domain-containing protein n=1 Tax=Naegleria lovaniensis TaxID=51637 RepID=A0AA88KV30_NAELO|nr:uncharacterized protein C9374_014137 [Naegleria lovaniensis]KAG2389577.1 hypothetical protein C9374_014137 [Naegleria lovaniensis]
MLQEDPQLTLSARQPIQYPRIQHLDQIIENIGQTKGFTFQHNGPFTFVSYKIVSSESFPPVPIKEISKTQLVIDLDSHEFERRMLRREIRGLVFDRESKRLLYRSMPKFFNIDEREECNLKIVEKMLIQLKRETGKERPFILLEKLDGSLCTPCIEFLHERNDHNYNSGGGIVSRNETTLIPFRLRFRTKLDYQNEHSQSIEEFVYGIVRDDSLVRPQNNDNNNNSLNENDEDNEITTDELGEATSSTTLQEDLRKYHEKRKELHESKLPIFYCSQRIAENLERNSPVPFTLSFDNGASLFEQTQHLRNGNLIRFCVDWISKGFTPLFEYFSPNHRVVVNYGNSPFISLLALRQTILGNFVSYDEMKQTCKEYGEIECVKACTNEIINLQTDLKSIKKSIEEEKGHEGYVMILENGLMFKIKSNWYLNIHKTNEMLITESMREGRIWYMIFDNTLDDVLPHVHSDEHRKRLCDFNDKVIYHLNQTVEYLAALMQRVEEKVQENCLTHEPNAFIKMAKETCKNLKHSFFCGTIMKVKGLVEKKLLNGEIKDASEKSTETNALLLDCLVQYLKPLVKKVELIRDILTSYLVLDLIEPHQTTTASSIIYSTQEEAMKDLILFTSQMD